MVLFAQESDEVAMYFECRFRTPMGILLCGVSVYEFWILDFGSFRLRLLSTSAPFDFAQGKSLSRTILDFRLTPARLGAGQAEF